MNPTATSAVLGPDIIAGQQEYLLPSMLHLYSEPLCLTEGQGVRVRDENGSEYLDLFSGILTTSVGHCHPRIVDAMTEQMGLRECPPSGSCAKDSEHCAGRSQANVLH